MRLSFKANIPAKIDEKYFLPESKAKTVGILGSSKPTEEIMDYMNACSNITKGLILSGKNIIHGCGNSGIMGVAYQAGQQYSKKDENGTPIQNLAIIAQPMWGDEDTDNCVPIVTSNSEADRIEKFAQVANSFIIFAGSATTLQEATTLIAKNYYGKAEDKKQIILVGKDFFKGLQEQYQKLYDSKLIKCPPEELFTIVDTQEEVEALIRK